MRGIKQQQQKRIYFFHTQIITHINAFVVGVSKER
jgi:hypothetical protein